MIHSRDAINLQVERVIEAFEAYQNAYLRVDSELIESTYREYQDEKAILAAMNLENEVVQENNACEDGISSITERL